MEALRVDKIAPQALQGHMLRLSAAYRPDRSNGVRHVYFSRRLNRWFAVSRLPDGLVQVSHYAQCPCAARA
jgi:hypothetical protein